MKDFSSNSYYRLETVLCAFFQNVYIHRESIFTKVNINSYRAHMRNRLGISPKEDSRDNGLFQFPIAKLGPCRVKKVRPYEF